MSKKILQEAHRQQLEVQNDGESSASTSNKPITRLGAESDESEDEDHREDDMDGDYYQNIVRIFIFGAKNKL